jgi:hypothetical protein
MRLFLALGLTLIVGLGAAFRPSDNLPGREVGVAESCRVIGGNNAGCTPVTCGPYTGCSGICVFSGTNTTCNSICSTPQTCGGG